jgi:hypothetical protein
MIIDSPYNSLVHFQAKLPAQADQTGRFGGAGRRAGNIGARHRSLKAMDGHDIDFSGSDGPGQMPGRRCRSAEYMAHASLFIGQTASEIPHLFAFVHPSCPPGQVAAFSHSFATNLKF